MFSSDFYVDIAQRAEAAKLDFVFRPDSMFLNMPALETGPGFASLDPTILLATLARETSRIGLLSTVSTMFMPPYILARQIMSLHWLSNGRAGWKHRDSARRPCNFGLETMPSSNERYARAEDYTEIVRLLWQSYPADAMVRDRLSGRFNDTALIRPIDHESHHFRVKGPLNLPAYGKAPVPLIQAGASEGRPKLRRFHGRCHFGATPDRQAAVDLRADLRRRAQALGRHPDISACCRDSASIWRPPGRRRRTCLPLPTSGQTGLARLPMC